MDSEDVHQFFSSATCQEINEILKSQNISYYESQNSTAQQYLQSLLASDCIPKPYPRIGGIKKWTVTITLMSFLIIGLIGNLLSATIMFRRARRGLSSYFYLAVLAIVDICVLYTGCLLFFLEIAFDYRPQLYSSWFCCLTVYIQHLFTYVSSWLVVALTLERLLVVRYPLRSIRFSRIHSAYATTSSIVIFFLLYTSHCFITTGLTTVNIQSDQGYHPDRLVCDLLMHKRLFSYLDLCFYSIFPSILILISNTLLVMTMLHAIQQRKNYLQASSYQLSDQMTHRNKMKTLSTLRTRSAESCPAGRSSTLYNKQRIYRPSYLDHGKQQKRRFTTLPDSTNPTNIRLTCLLLLISLIFVVCTLPISIRLIIADYLFSQKSTARWQLTQLSLMMLMFLNHTINFILYCLTGRTFRNESRKLLWHLCIFKGFRISCTTSPDSEKHHQHQRFAMIEINRPACLTPHQRYFIGGRRVANP